MKKYMFDSIDEYRDIVGFELSPSFEDGWRLARLMTETNESIDETPEELRNAIRDTERFKKFLKSSDSLKHLD